jgi:predicted DNA-binding transcriptional regulator AlpA
MKDLSVIQVAEILKCTPRTVRNLIVRGAFPSAYKFDPKSKSVYFIPKSDVDKFIKQRATK